MNHFILECNEGSKTAGQTVSHFYKVENSICTCVFCGNQVETNYFNLSVNQFNNFDPYQSAVGQRN
jgi:hypothetical protein